MVDDELLFDLNIPTTAEQIEQYDQKPRQYFNERVFPWLKEKQKLKALVDGIAVFVERIYGIPNTDNKKSRWKVEPVSKAAQFISKPRILSMNRLLVENGYPPRVV